MGQKDDRPEPVTSSGIPLKVVYTAADVAEAEAARVAAGGEGGTAADLPGEYPYTRGIHATMYRGRLWTMRQYAGFGTAEETNARYHYFLSRGQTGLSVAFDLPTQMGYDADHPRAAGEVGRAGVAISTLGDMRDLFHGIPLERVSTSMTINATAPLLLALYILVAREQGVPPAKLQGTVQNDILKEYAARGTYIYPPGPSLRLAVDVIEHCLKERMPWNPISISGYHMREAGATAAQEVAFTLADGLAYVEAARARGLDVDAFAPRLSFFFAAHSHLFEEVAKFRAARRLWARCMRERCGAKDPSSWRLRFHTQTAGSTLTAQQPEANVVRVALEALAAVLGGTQSLHTNAWDEALALPSEGAARLALRTQQVLAHESGVADTADPCGGSHLVEALTAEIERQARDYLARIDEMGGAIEAIARGFYQEEIHRAAYAQQRRVEAGEEVVVGVNRFVEEEDGAALPMAGGQAALPQARRAALEKRQVERLAAFRARRDGARAGAACARVEEAARGRENMMPAILAALEAGATLGEVSDALRRVFGEHRERR